MTSKQLRIHHLERQAERGEHLIRRYLQRQHSFFLLQLLAIVAGFLASLVTFRLSLLLSFICVGVAVGVFVFGLHMLRSLREGLLRAKIWVQLKKTSLARLHLDWEHIPQVELPQIKNYHFREDVIDGKMMFDYHLWPGPSPTTNALKIMQIAGLPVDWKRGH